MKCTCMHCRRCSLLWLQVLGSYREAIMHGSKHIRQALPRLLTLFYDWGSEHVALGHRSAAQHERAAHTAVRAGWSMLMR